MNARKVVVATDVLLEHTTCPAPPSLLRLASRRYFCYTTVFNAMQLLAGARSEFEREQMTAAMAAMKVLGLNARSAPRFGRLLAAHPGSRVWDTMTAGLCLESRLPLLTGRVAAFRRFRGLTVLPAHRLRHS